MKNPLKIIKIVIIVAVIIVLSSGLIAIIDQFSHQNETTPLPKSISSQIPNYSTKSEMKVQSKPVSVQTEPVQTEPVQTEPVQTEPVQTEPVQTEPVQTEPVQTEPVQTEPVQTEPVQTESNFVCLGTKECITGTVDEIVDGDTLYINGIKIRISLTNTPELNEKGFSEATEFTKQLCPVGSIANIDQDDLQPYDKFKRMLGKVTCSGGILNSELLYHKLADISTQYCSTSEFSTESWAQEYGCTTESQRTPQQIPKETPKSPNDPNDCDPSYPDFCIPYSPPDLDCKDVLPHKKFTVNQPDPHRFDGDKDGIGCE